MYQIAYITNGMASTLHSSYELSRRLEQAGHRVTYLSHADIGRSVAEHGYPFVPLTGDRVFRERALNTPPPERWALWPPRWVRWVAQRRRIRRRSIEQDEIERIVRRLNPDLLLVDMECHFAVIATARLKIPTVLPIVWFSLFRDPELPPMHTSLKPGPTPRQKRAVRVAWWRCRVAAFLHRWRQRCNRRGLGSVLRPVSYATALDHELKAVARCRGYRLRSQTDRSQWSRPFLYRHLPILCFNARELDFPHRPHPNLNYVGPMVYRDRREVRLDAGSTWRWKQFTDVRQRATGRHRPLVYCSLGTYWSADVAFYRRVLEVFARRSDWDLVLGLGGKLSGGTFAPVPPNVLLLDWAPQLEVLKLADCAITHGGITTINECIHFGVPMVVYSTKRVDQNGCAARVAFHRLGVVADKDSDTAPQLERNIDRVLSDPVFGENLAAMREHFRSYEENSTAVGVLEAIMDGSFDGEASSSC